MKKKLTKNEILYFLLICDLTDFSEKNRLSVNSLITKVTGGVGEKFSKSELRSILSYQLFRFLPELKPVENILIESEIFPNINPDLYGRELEFYIEANDIQISVNKIIDKRNKHNYLNNPIVLGR